MTWDILIRRGTVIDVDSLGHIFEQSITDLERLRNELDGLIEPKRDDGGRGAGIVDGDAHVSEGVACEKVIENSLPDKTEPASRGQHLDVASSAEVLRFNENFEIAGRYDARDGRSMNGIELASALIFVVELFHDPLHYQLRKRAGGS